MLWPTISIIFLTLSVAIIAAVLWRKAPQLRMIDVSAIPTERARRLKEQIILQKFERMGAEKFGVVTKTARHGITAASKVGRRAVQRLYAMEQYYQKLKRVSSDSGSVDSETVKRLLGEAESLVREEEYIPAEKRYIEIISHSPKHVKAYEGLGNLYLKSGQLTQARETLLFTLRLSPDDASVHMSLAQVEIEDRNPRKAVDHLRRAVELRKANPKFIDLYIETSLEAGMGEDARKGLALLKEANPENQKIAEFEKRLAAVSTDPSQPEGPLV